MSHFMCICLLSIIALLMFNNFCIDAAVPKEDATKMGGRKSYSIRGTRMQCKDGNPKFLYNLTCSSKPISRSEEIINGAGTLQPNVTLRTIFWRMVLHVKFGTIFRQLMFDSKVDLCALYRGAAKYAFITEMKLDAEEENIKLGCPVTGTRFVRNLRLRKDLYPNVMPEGEFRLDNIIYTRDNGMDEKLLTAEMWFVVAHNDTKRF